MYCPECEKLRLAFIDAQTAAERTYMPGNQPERDAVIEALRACDNHFDQAHRRGGPVRKAQQLELIAAMV